MIVDLGGSMWARADEIAAVCEWDGQRAETAISSRSYFLARSIVVLHSGVLIAADDSAATLRKRWRAALDAMSGELTVLAPPVSAE